jgi:hypothetical protein
MGLALVAKADPFSTPPAPGDFPMNYARPPHNKPIGTAVYHTLKGVDGVTWKVYCEREAHSDKMKKGCRIPNWYVVVVPNPVYDPKKPDQEGEIDLNDIGLQGKNHRVRFRVTQGHATASYWELDDSLTYQQLTVPMDGKTFLTLLPSRFVAPEHSPDNKEHWDRLGIIRFKGPSLVIECYRDSDARPPAGGSAIALALKATSLANIMQAGGTEPPPPTSGSEH